MYTFKSEYKGYHQVKIVPKDQLKTIFTTPWARFCYIILSFGLCNAARTFPCLMNKVFEAFLGSFNEFSLMTLEFILIEFLILPNLS